MHHGVYRVRKNKYICAINIDELDKNPRNHD